MGRYERMAAGSVPIHDLFELLGLALLGCFCGCASNDRAESDTFSVGGSLSGLAESAFVVLQNNGGDDLTLTADGPFAFETRLADQASYEVTVRKQPRGQKCAVARRSGRSFIGTRRFTGSLSQLLSTPLLMRGDTRSRRPGMRSFKTRERV